MHSSIHLLDYRYEGNFAQFEIVTRKGKAVSVIIPIKEFEELLERLEDRDDVAWLKRARRKPLHYRLLDEYLAEFTRR